MINRDNPRPFPHRGWCVNFLGQTLVRFQDVKVRVSIAAIQLTRQRTRTADLGGNGQFSRLSALAHVADENGRPRRGALPDDRELSLHLTMAGHRNEYTKHTYVGQEGLTCKG